MKVCFLYPPQSLNEGQYLKKISRNFSRNAQILPSLGLAYLASTLRMKGYEVSFLDANALNLNLSQIVKKLKTLNPNFLLYTALTDNFPNTLSWIKGIRQELDVPVIIGGPHLSTYP